MQTSPASRARELLELEDRIRLADERGDPPAALALLLRQAEVIDRERRAVAVSAAHHRLHHMAEETRTDPKKLTPEGRRATLRLALAEAAGALAAANGLPGPKWAIPPAAADRGAADLCLIEAAEVARVVIGGIAKDDRLALALAVAAETPTAAAFEKFLRLCDPFFDTPCSGTKHTSDETAAPLTRIQRRIIDHLQSGPKTLDDLDGEAGARSTVSKHMKSLIAAGMVTKLHGGGYSLTK